ncbi:MAG: Holliday junction resolvase RuvX [Gammaproteobacteria bacterium]|jgi:putative Holliday junction resolvase|nr:Holliday junction resolvase RuvX [Gammaproteobacteria bacterium]
MAEPINLLGFDFGSKRIGIAFASQASTEPVILQAISARDGIPDWEQINKLVKEWQTQAFVVGIPYNMDGSVGEMAHRARKFANRLSNRFALPSYVVDERLSTYAAKQVHLSQGGSSNWKKHGVDGIAAQLILQSWFVEPEHRLASQPFKEQG